jgi:hypothetical protein
LPPFKQRWQAGLVSVLALITLGLISESTTPPEVKVHETIPGIKTPKPNVSEKGGMSHAQITGALYGTLLGHIDACGITVQGWHAKAMGQQVSNLAKNDDDRELAIGMTYSMKASAQKSPTMKCADVRAALKQLEKELR